MIDEYYREMKMAGDTVLKAEVQPEYLTPGEAEIVANSLRRLADNVEKHHSKEKVK